MTSDEISRIIAEDLRSASTQLAWYGRPLEECLLTPRRMPFFSSLQDEEPEDLWLVFEERPTPGEGYRVVFDEDLRMFGLATSGADKPVLIGLYGSFVETLNSM